MALSVTLPFGGVTQASPTNFVEVTNFRERWNGNGAFDWANGSSGLAAVTSGASACHVGANGGITCPGTNGLFDGGKFGSTVGGKFTPPTAPTQLLTPAQQAANNIPGGAYAFIVDPMSSDVQVACPFPPSGGGGPTLTTGDPTTYTGSGSETNGDLLSADTWGTSGNVPPKDEITNTAAVAHVVPDPSNPLSPAVNEIFFEVERLVNNGDSHIDLEFLQSTVNLKPDATGCAGSFSGDRSQGDMLLAIDFTTGGTLGGATLYQWHCAAEPGPQPNIGTICNPPKNGKGIPHYQSTSSSAVSFGVNAGGAIDCGGWACRNADGSQATTLLTNDFFEGGIDLKQLGFTGCLSSFLPHTRSSQSFTSVLKDFALHSFNTCNPSTTLSVASSPPVFDSTTYSLVHAGDSATFTFSENNNGNVNLTNPHVNVTTTGGTLGSNCTNGVAQFTSGDTNSNGFLDPGETWVFTCTITFNTAGSFTITGTGHGTFNGQDITAPAVPAEQKSASVNVISPSTTLVKVASPTSVEPGGKVTYTYTETNGSTGGNGASDLAIGNVTVTDNGCSPLSAPTGDSNANGKLDKGETWTFTCTTTLQNTTSNIATASGTDALGFTVTWCQNANNPGPNTICSQTEQTTASVTVIHPATTLNEVISAVATATYTYVEKNTGDTPITNVSVSDNKCTPVTFVSSSDGSLASDPLQPNATRTFTCSTTVGSVDTDPSTPAGVSISLSDGATGTGTDALGNPVPTGGETDGTTVNLSVSHP
jgi:uncharacterized repeat protein (TIGR01451 family)